MKTSVLILPVLVLAVLATTACSNGKAASAAAPQAMPVKVRTASSQKVDETTEYVATLKSRDSAVVSPQVEGIITKIFVRSGDRVADGAPLMQIDPEKQQATLKSQESATAAQLAQLKLAQQNYDRTSGLAAAGVVSKRNSNRWEHRLTSRRSSCITTRLSLPAPVSSAMFPFASATAC
jgi:multidrug efflux pump subunit AcrA (membrane-fusion protein)